MPRHRCVEMGCDSKIQTAIAAAKRPDPHAAPRCAARLSACNRYRFLSAHRLEQVFDPNRFGAYSHSQMTHNADFGINFRRARVLCLQLCPPHMPNSSFCVAAHSPHSFITGHDSQIFRAFKMLPTPAVLGKKMVGLVSRQAALSCHSGRCQTVVTAHTPSVTSRPPHDPPNASPPVSPAPGRGGPQGPGPRRHPPLPKPRFVE